MSNYPIFRSALMMLILLSMTACVSVGQPVMDTSSVNTSMSAQDAAQADIGQAAKIVQWGGQIIDITNQEDTTVLQVLSYPLNSRGMPNRHSKPAGRFVIIYPGYLESYDYAAGKMLTAIGKVTGQTEENIGNVKRQLPVMKTQQLHLWKEYEGTPRFFPHFGIGVNIGF